MSSFLNIERAASSSFHAAAELLFLPNSGKGGFPLHPFLYLQSKTTCQSQSLFLKIHKSFFWKQLLEWHGPAHAGRLAAERPLQF
jgi:hypothetical protein